MSIFAKSEFRVRVVIDVFVFFVVKLDSHQRIRRPSHPSCSKTSRVDSVIHWIKHYPRHNSIGFASAYPLDSDLSRG